VRVGTPGHVAVKRSLGCQNNLHYEIVVSKKHRGAIARICDLDELNL
jgi:hypothetical protein